jgi:hypothetical protein
LLNYTGRPAGSVRITVQGKFENVKLLSPDSPRDPARLLPSSGPVAEIEAPTLGTYSLVVLTRR